MYVICCNCFVPQTERVYLQVFLPQGSKEKSKPMFFCQRWSVGKVIDFAASSAGLRNDNNKSTAKVPAGRTSSAGGLRLCHTRMFVTLQCASFLSQQKLRLCHMTSGEALPLDHTLEAWMAREDCPLYNGGNVVLEYLSEEERFLKNVDSYLE